MAEMPFMPLAPAITAAIFDATGVWIDALPLTPYRVQDALFGADGLDRQQHRCGNTRGQQHKRHCKPPEELFGLAANAD